MIHRCSTALKVSEGTRPARKSGSGAITQASTVPSSMDSDTRRPISIPAPTESTPISVPSLSAAACGVIEIFTVRRRRHPDGVMPLISWRVRRSLRFRDLHARTALHVVHPDFKGCDPKPRFGDVDVISVGRPHRRSKFSVAILRHLLHVAAIRMHDPDVFTSFAVGDESNPFSIWREFRLAVESHAARDQLCLAALDGKRVNVAEQLKHNSFAVGRYVQGDPGAFIGNEFNFSLGLQRQAFLLVLLLVVFLVLLFLLRFAALGNAAWRKNFAPAQYADHC